MDWLKYFSRKWLFKMVHHVGIKKTVRSDERNISRVCILHSIPSIAHSDTSMLSEHKATIVQMPWKIVVPEVVFKYIYGGYVSFKNDEKPANVKHSWSYINAVESAHCIKDDDCILTTMTQHSKKDKVSPSFSNTHVAAAVVKETIQLSYQGPHAAQAETGSIDTRRPYLSSRDWARSRHLIRTGS